MLLDLKLIFVAFSAGRLPFPNLRFLLGKSEDFAARFFLFMTTHVLTSEPSALGSHALRMRASASAGSACA